MNPRIKTLLFLILTVYIIPGTAIFLLDRSMLFYYLFINSWMIPYYVLDARKKRSCKFLGMEFKF